MAPAVFLNTGEHYPMIAAEARCFFESQRDRIINAVMSRPTASLFLEFEDGRVVSSEDYDASKGTQEWGYY